MLFVGGETGPTVSLIGLERLVCEQGFKPDYDRLLAEGFIATTKAKGSFLLILLNATPSKAETFANIARAWAMLEGGGTLLINADKTEGADSLLKHLRAALPVTEFYSKAHGRLIRLDRKDEPAPDWALAVAANGDGYLTAPGMFSADKADFGSKLLAAKFTADLKGSVADLGAGWGYLSAKALAASPNITELHLFEANAAALDAARLNVKDMRAHFHWVDVNKLTAADGPFDAVICNPPFHTSHAADPALGNAFIAAAARILTPHGRAVFVANRQLPYEAALDSAFRKVERIEQISGFKIFLCERPKQTTRR